MKLKKIAASIVAAAVAFSAFAFSASAEEAKDEKLTLLTSELTADLKTNMVFIEGVGVVDITGADFDSSENGAADENANLDVDFDGISYLSKENLKIWQETGVLTLSKLKADFDTTGLKWGLFNAKRAENGYVQLVKMEKQKVEDSGEEENVVTYRGLYKIENGEIKKCCDLDTFWTGTRNDGTSVGFKTVNKTGAVKGYEDYTFDGTTWTEAIMVLTQPDGTKKETVVATRNVEDIFEGEATDAGISGAAEIGGITWSIPWSGDVLADVGYVNKYAYAIYGDDYIITKINKDGTQEEIYHGEGYLYDMHGIGSSIFWTKITPPNALSETVFLYNSNTGKVEKYGAENFDIDNGEYWFTTPEMSTYQLFDLDFEYCYDNNIIVNMKVYYNNYEDGKDEFIYLVDGYTILHGLNDFDNWQSKTYYKNLNPYSVKDGSNSKIIFTFETKDGKVGYMDENEKVLAYFDKVGGFMADYYAPVIKDGKAYLIDAEMNTVSTEIEADDVVAINDELFLAKNGDKLYFVTYGSEVKDPATETVVVDYSDNGVTASANKGVIADGAALSVKAVEDKTDETKATYEISFKKADGTTVQPNGTVTVKIPVPDAFKDKTIYVYRVEADGKYTDMNAKIENGFVVFETDHFSEYVLTTEKQTDKPADSSDSETSSDSNSSSGSTSPDTGVAGLSLTLGIVALAGAAMVISRKKR